MLRNLIFCIGVLSVVIGVCHSLSSRNRFENRHGGALKALTTDLHKSDWMQLAKSWFISALFLVLGMVLILLSHVE